MVGSWAESKSCLWETMARALRAARYMGPWAAAPAPRQAVLGKFIHYPVLKINYYNYDKIYHFKCMVQRHQERSHCSSTITIIRLWNCFHLAKLKLCTH